MSTYTVNLNGHERTITRNDDGTFSLPSELAHYPGLGTALKPAFEPVVVARKPLSGTVAANVLAHGTGALNIDGCRVGDEGGTRGSDFVPNDTGIYNHGIGGRVQIEQLAAGRWPANVILDESQAAALDEQSGELHSQDPRTRASRSTATGVTEMGTGASIEYADSGGASRFFYVVREDNESCPNPEPATSAPGVPLDGLAERFRYVAKAPTDERPRVNGIAHPTTKPLTLMRWLVRLVTPPGGTVLEPFAGSGTTVEACILEGFRCIAIEREADYLPLIKQRIDRRLNPVEAVRGSGGDGGLFDLLEDT